MPVDSAETPVLIDLTDGRELIINRVISTGFFGSQHVVLLGCNRAGASTEGKLQNECAIVARLRFDNGMAQMLRDTLNDSINALTVPVNVKAN